MNHVKLVDFDYVHWFTEMVPLEDGTLVSQEIPTKECVLFINYADEVKIFTLDGTLLAVGQVGNYHYLEGRRLNQSVNYILTPDESATVYGLLSMAGL